MSYACIIDGYLVEYDAIYSPMEALYYKARDIVGGFVAEKVSDIALTIYKIYEKLFSNEILDLVDPLEEEPEYGPIEEDIFEFAKLCMISSISKK